MLEKENLLKLAKVICFSVVFAIIIYFANFFLFAMFPKLSVLGKDLLFLEGLASMTFGIFLLISENPKRQKPPPDIPPKQRLLYGGVTVVGEIRFSLLALAFILMGTILFLLYVLPC
jgi:hypothetical protein